MNLLYFILCCFGMTQILIYGKIFEKIRPKHHFFHCPMCMGWHVGIFIWFISRYTQLFTFDRNIITAFLLGCLSSGSSYILCVVFGDEGINYVKKHLD